MLRCAVVAAGLAVLTPALSASSHPLPAAVELNSGWWLADHATVPAESAAVAQPGFAPSGWYPATVPGTVLTTLVNNHVYPEPTYGENSRPEKIPESLAHSRYWYRTEVTVPRAYRGRTVWLNFDGINYAAEVWVNGHLAGTMRGAFLRGRFDITAWVRPGQRAAVAVLVSPQPNPGVPHEHTVRNGVGLNGGISAMDGPTFLSTIGWDWLAAVRDRNTGIWQRVYLSATGAVQVRDPLVTTELPLPRTDSAEVTVAATVENGSDQPQTGVLQGSFGTVQFARAVTLAPHSWQRVTFSPADTAVLHLEHPQLWWPNGYGPQNLYHLQLRFVAGKEVSDESRVTFGVRKITYVVADSENLTISVNGVRMFIRGGNWGLDEAMKRIPRERLEAQIRLHQLANLNLIRNWVGQSTSEEFYELCDQYGLLLWDEFFQPNPSDGPDPSDLQTYLANVRDKILRYRNHPSIAIWCARNEGYPPKVIDDRLRTMMAELEPVRLYQPSSTDGKGVISHGPYHWRTPREFYEYTNEPFKTEIGSMSVPTLESIQGMMPEKDWTTINDDWAQHDFAKGAQQGDKYPEVIAARYGGIANLADFVRKAQLANYEAFRAMYEGRNARLFAPSTAVITWMSNPAQPSFVWQLYHHDLEPNASLYAVKSAGEMVHVQLNELSGVVQVINNLPHAVAATVRTAIYSLDGRLLQQNERSVDAAASSATAAGKLELPAGLTGVYFVQLRLTGKDGALLSQNFYWQGQPEHPDDLTALNTMENVTLSGTISAATTAAGRTLVSVTLKNATAHVALMTHLQLRRGQSGERVLPSYASDNYLSLVPGESRTVTIEAATADLHGEMPVVAVDGWNGTVVETEGQGARLVPNQNAQVDRWPRTSLPVVAGRE
ncbi:MAG: glycoside hydrolase family 2 [Acidobacteriota bacterium]|nr:glycoside hydrolase family 2 [Acidobacteriota bacterium]